MVRSGGLNIGRDSRTAKTSTGSAFQALQFAYQLLNSWYWVSA